MVTHKESSPPAVLLVLASASPARAATLRAAGIDPLIRVSEVDEEAVLHRVLATALSEGRDAPPSEQVTALARAKAESVVDTVIASTGRRSATSRRPTLIVGCDSMLEFRGGMLGKPHEPDVAFARIKEFQGHEATLWTGHHLILYDPAHPKSRKACSASAATTVRMGTMTDEEIWAYVETGEPLEVAGAFTIDGFGGAFVEGVVGDPHSVVGISLPLLRHLAADLGVFWPSLWN